MKELATRDGLKYDHKGVPLVKANELLEQLEGMVTGSAKLLDVNELRKALFAYGKSYEAIKMAIGRIPETGKLNSCEGCKMC